MSVNLKLKVIKSFQNVDEDTHFDWAFADSTSVWSCGAGSSLNIWKNRRNSLSKGMYGRKKHNEGIIALEKISKTIFDLLACPRWVGFPIHGFDQTQCASGVQVFFENFGIVLRQPPIFKNSLLFSYFFVDVANFYAGCDHAKKYIFDLVAWRNAN